MNINTVVLNNKIKFTSRRVPTIISTVSIASGIICGSIFYILFEQLFTSNICDYFIKFITDFSNKNSAEIFSSLILTNLPYVIIMYILGTNARGSIFIPALTFIKASGLGIVTTYIFCKYTLKGIEYCLLVFFPSKIILIFSLLLLTENCYLTSSKIGKCIKSKYEADIELSKYDLKTIIICLIMLVSCLIELISIITFSSLFTFS